jgi:uncharacterized protein YdgA (DUF945 family)
MKKIVILVVVLVLLLVVAPWGIGRLAESRVNAGLDKLVEQAPYLSIVERKWTSGWFRSEQEVTFEVLGPWLRAMNPATVLDEMKKADEETAVEDQEQVANLADPAEGGGAAAGQDSADDVVAADADEGAEDAPGEEAAGEAEAPLPPIRFTVRNEILHGPVLWPASLGLARVNSKLVLPEDARKSLIETFGTDDPVRMSSRVGFFGGGSTTFSGDGHDIKFKDGSGNLAYGDYKLKIGYSKNLDSFDMKGELPRFEATNSKDSSTFTVSGISLVGESERVKGELYDTDFKLSVDKVVGIGADKAETTVEGIHYVIKSDVADGFMDVGAKFGSGKVKNAALTELDFQLDEIHYDFTVRRLHADTLDKMMVGLKDMYTKPVATVADVESVMLAPLKEHGLALLKHDPEFVVDRMGIVTPQGEGVIKGVVRLKGLEEADFTAGSMSWINKIDADFTIECAQKLIEKFPNGATGAGVAVDQGFAKRDGDKLVSHIEFKKSELKVNGKAQPIPGFGGPPEGEMGEMEEGEMPPDGMEAEPESEE